MATITQLLTRVQTRLDLASGLDVQVHAQDKLVETLREVYETLFDDHWWRNLIYVDKFELDGVTGTVTDDLTDQIHRYEDIHSIFINESTVPLPMMDIGQNMDRVHRTSVTPVNDPTKVFRIVPIDTTGTLTVWYRSRIPDRVWDDGEFDTNIPFDDQLMIAGVCADFLIDEGINAESAQKFAAKYQARLAKLRTNEWQLGISKSPQRTDNALRDWTEVPSRGW